MRKKPIAQSGQEKAAKSARDLQEKLRALSAIGDGGRRHQVSIAWPTQFVGVTYWQLALVHDRNDAIVLWNTVYLERAVQALRNRGYPVDDTLLRHLSPLGWEHINLTADYVSPLSVRYFPDPQWAAMQMALGDALSTLGERESGTVRLEEAIAAYRAALEEMTRARVPLDWAMPGTISAVRSGSSGSARRMERRR